MKPPFTAYEYMRDNPPPTTGKKKNPVACEFACERDCTLVGHAYEAVRFLNQCLENGIADSAVEEDPNYNRFLLEVAKNQQLLLARIGQRARKMP